MISREQITPIHSGIMSGIVSLLGLGAIEFVGSARTLSEGDIALWGVIQLSALAIWFSWYRQLPEETSEVALEEPGGTG